MCFIFFSLIPQVKYEYFPLPEYIEYISGVVGPCAPSEYLNPYIMSHTSLLEVNLYYDRIAKQNREKLCSTPISLSNTPAVAQHGSQSSFSADHPLPTSLSAWVLLRIVLWLC